MSALGLSLVTVNINNTVEDNTTILYVIRMNVKFGIAPQDIQKFANLTGITIDASLIPVCFYKKMNRLKNW